MTSAAEVRVGACKRCGAEVRRQTLPDSPLGRMLDQLPFWCDPCISDDVRAVRDEQQARQARAQSQAMAERVRRSGLPAVHHDVPLSALEHDPRLIEAAREWVHNGGGLMLVGEIGRGKTTIAGAAAWERLQRGVVLWTSAPLLLARLGSGLGTEEHGQAIDMLSGRSALVLDDIDKARPTAYGAEQVFLAVDQRVEHEAPLLVTTNLSPAGLAEKWPAPYGEAIASRLVGYCRVATVGGDDRRLVKQQAPRRPQDGWQSERSEW